MKLNETVIKGKWLEIKGDLQKTWGKLTDDELEQTKGDLTAVSGLLVQRYGEVQETYAAKLAEIYKKFTDKKDETISAIKDTLKN